MFGVFSLSSVAHVFGLHKVQSINDDLNASLATADELSKEFSSLLKKASSESEPQNQVQYRSCSSVILFSVSKYFLNIN